MPLDMKITEQEKSELRNRISNSIFRHIRRKRILKYGATIAATVVLALFAINSFDTNKPVTSSIKEVANSMHGQEMSEHIQLVLNNNQSIEITENEASISYSKTGEQVTVGTTKSIRQTHASAEKISFNTLWVPYGKRTSIILTDGSKVWLNSGSKLVFPAVFTKERREVYLDGEAIFEVAHNKERPFVVKTGEQEIEVLGTVFNVSSYPDENVVSTVLKSGSVKIKYKQNNITLNPGKRAVYDRANNQSYVNKVDVEPYFSWRDGVFIFKSDSMESIMKKIARYYNVEIKIDNSELAKTTFSGYLDLRDNVENVIKTIQETTKFNYNIIDEKLIIN